MKPEARRSFSWTVGTISLKRMTTWLAAMVVLVTSIHVAAAPPSEEEVQETRKKIRDLENELAKLRSKLRYQLSYDEDGNLITGPREMPEPAEGVEPVDTDGMKYPVSAIKLEYSREHPGHPSLHDVRSVRVELVRTAEGLIAPRKGDKATAFRMWDFDKLDNVNFYGSAIRKLSVSIVGHFNDMGIIGVFVGPDPNQINSRGEDLRPAGDTSLTLIIRTAVISEIRTLASGDRIDVEDRINNPAHARLARNLPIQIGDGIHPDDLLRRDLLDEYVGRLNRHPGRRVDIAVSAADSQEPGSVALDMLVSENKPWMVYFQISNTGTESTNEWRERFGFIHNQLTGNDDVFTLDYITAAFENAHSVIASYEAPLLDSQEWRWRIYGNYSTYTAEDVGFAGESFEGESWGAGIDLIKNVYHSRNIFVDAFGGLEFKNIRVANNILLTRGEGDFLFLSAGLKAERRTETENSSGTIRLRYNLDDLIDTEDRIRKNFSGPDLNMIDFLGRGVQRNNIDGDYMIFDWNLTHSMYLEPLLFPTAWNDPTTPDSSTLAHELFFAFRGQTTFGARVNAQETRTVGGLYTVRGYEESEASGDTAVIFTAEYRFHLPRIFEIQPDPSKTPVFGKPFRWAPQQVYGRPDWDLVLKGFFDYGKTFIEDRQGVESDQDLASLGVGLELLVKNNFNFRADWGIALDRGTYRRTEGGDNRFHFVATILY